jgi:hypothetical protein
MEEYFEMYGKVYRAPSDFDKRICPCLYYEWKKKFNRYEVTALWEEIKECTIPKEQLDEEKHYKDEMNKLIKQMRTRDTKA